MIRVLLLFFVLLLRINAFSQNPKRELRAAWISTVYGIDWPSSADAPATQRTKLIAILDALKASGINTVYFQVRTTGDALYNSTLVPWSHWLTGNYGQNSGWDPLAFAIEESHKRGLEIHAWLNPYRAAIAANFATTYATNHMARVNPNWLITAGTTRYFNPGIANVRSHIVSVVEEIVNNYNVDGIHFDDYFYLSGLTNADDDTQFATDPGGFNNRADWRRDNVTLMIKGVNNKIKALKPWVKFGISPSGIYQNFTVPNVTPTVSTTGSAHYSVQYADTKYWMEQGLIDYLIPQVYWAFIQTVANAKFNYIVDYWNRQNFNRHLYIGLATYRVDPADDATWSSTIAREEIRNQINYLRANSPNIKGSAHFTTHDLISAKAGVKEAMDLVRLQYNTPAIIPVMTYIDNIAPAQPTNLVTSLSGGRPKLNWSAPAATTDELQKVVRYAIYRSTNANIDFENAANLIAVIGAQQTEYTDNTVTSGLGTSYYYVIKSLDRMSNESAASNVAIDMLAPPARLINFTAKLDEKRIRLEWSTQSETNLDFFSIEKAGADQNYLFLDRKNASTTNTSTRMDYFIWDNDPVNGVNHYKLTQVDRSGKYWSPSVSTSVIIEELIVTNTVVFPNPTQSDINFSLANFSGKSIKTKLITIHGQIVHEEEFDTSTGEKKFKLNLKQYLAKGHYILALSDIGFKKNIKLVVL